MTRADAKNWLISMGIEDPTDEQISNCLNQVNAETKKERDRADKFKGDAEKASELQKQLDEINQQGLSDLEKANNRIAELEKNNKKMEQRQKLAEIGIVGDNAEKLIGEDGALDFALLGTIIKDRETQAMAAKEKELLDGTGSPDGKKKEEDVEEPDVANAKLLNFGTKASDKSDADYYKLK